MSEINRALGAAGAPARLVCGERTYLLSPLTKRVQGDLEEWLFGRAVAALPASMDPAAYAGAVAALAERRAGGAYDFTGKLMDRAIRTVDGGVQLLLCLLRKHQPEMTEADAFALVEAHGKECIAAVNAMTAALRGNAQGAGEKRATPAAASA